MSASGQKQTFAVQSVMSALPPIADMCSALAHVCFAPIADIPPALPPIAEFSVSGPIFMKKVRCRVSYLTYEVAARPIHYPQYELPCARL